MVLIRVEIKTISRISCRDEKVKTNKRGQVHSWHLERYDMMHDTTHDTTLDTTLDTTRDTTHDMTHDMTHDITH